MIEPQWFGVAGTFSAVLVALFGQQVRPWINRPRLEVLWLNPSDSLSTTRKPDPEIGQEIWVTLIVKNQGRRDAATNVQVIVDSVERIGEPNSSHASYKPFPRTFFVPLKWSHTKETAATIPAGSSRRVDVVRYTSERNLATFVLARNVESRQFSTENAARLPGRGIYRINLTIAADNSRGVRRGISIIGKANKITDSWNPALDFEAGSPTITKLK